MKNIILFCLSLMIISCTNQVGKPQDNLYKKLIQNFQMVVPITNIEDSIYIIDDSYNLYMNILNMQIVDKEQFDLALYLHVKNNSFIPVDNELFNYAKKYCVIEDPIIKKEYFKDGIEGILSTYTLISPNEKISFFKEELSNEQITYIIYLLFQHDIYVSWGDEERCYIIRLENQ